MCGGRKKQKKGTGFSFLLHGDALDKMYKKILACCKTAEMLGMQGPFLLVITAVCIEINTIKVKHLVDSLKSSFKW